MTEVQDCRKCGATLKAEALFCTSCGTPVRSLDEMKCPACGSGNPEDANFCGGCGASLNGTGDLTQIIMEYFDNHSGKTSKNIMLGNEISNQLIEEHKKRYLDLSPGEQVLVLLGDQSFFSQGVFTGLAITNKRIHYCTLKNSIFASVVPWWLKGPRGSKIIAALESIEIAKLDTCLGTSYVGHELRVNDEILGYVRMGKGLMYDQNAKEFLNGLFNRFAQNGILEREVNNYWWS